MLGVSLLRSLFLVPLRHGLGRLRRLRRRRRHLRELRLVLLEAGGERRRGELRRERVEAEHDREQVHGRLAHERGLVPEAPDGEVRHHQPVRQGHRLLLRHRSPGLQHARARERRHVVHAFDEEVQEALLRAEQGRGGIGRGPVAFFRQRTGGGVRADQVAEHGDKRRTQRVRLAVQVREQQRDVGHGGLGHALRELGDENAHGADALGVRELLALVLRGIHGRHLAQQRGGEARVLEAVRGDRRALRDGAGKVLVLVQQVHERGGDVLQLAPLERTRAEHAERRVFGDLAAQRGLRLEGQAPELGEQPEERLRGLPRAKQVPQVSVEHARHDVHDALALLFPLPLHQGGALGLLRRLLVRLAGTGRGRRGGHAGGRARLGVGDVGDVVHEARVRFERLAMRRDDVGGVRGVARAGGEQGGDGGGEHGEVAAERVGDADAADGLERGEVARARVRAVEHILLQHAQRVVLAQIVRRLLDEIVRLGVAHAGDVDVRLGTERALALRGLEVRELEGDVELHRAWGRGKATRRIEGGTSAPRETSKARRCRRRAPPVRGGDTGDVARARTAWSFVGRGALRVSARRGRARCGEKCVRGHRRASLPTRHEATTAFGFVPPAVLPFARMYHMVRLFALGPFRYFGASFCARPTAARDADFSYARS
mmetsp:Transcript_2440/g.10150  ORF Transcript_2440/g.10150 Transcript_2440/m.10150 type:complete len:660 (+) Transcript_2440:625-2604(+)